MAEISIPLSGVYSRDALTFSTQKANLGDLEPDYGIFAIDGTQLRWSRSIGHQSSARLASRLGLYHLDERSRCECFLWLPWVEERSCTDIRQGSLVGKDRVDVDSKTSERVGSDPIVQIGPRPSGLLGGHAIRHRRSCAFRCFFVFDVNKRRKGNIVEKGLQSSIIDQLLLPSMDFARIPHLEHDLRNTI